MWPRAFVLISFIAYKGYAEPEEGEGLGESSLLVARHGSILRVDPHLNGSGSTSEPVVTSDDVIVAFDYMPEWRHLYWATENFIYRTPLYDPSRRTPVAATRRTAGLAVDRRRRSLYWADADAGRLEAAALDGRGRRTVYQTDHALGALALDPLNRQLFWTEYNRTDGRAKRLRSCRLDGSGARTVHSDDRLRERGPLALDPDYGSLYFYKTNGSHAEQWELNFAVGRALVVFTRKEPLPSSLSLVDGGFVYSGAEGLAGVRWVPRSYTLVHGDAVDTMVVLHPFRTLIDRQLSEASQIRVEEPAGEGHGPLEAVGPCASPWCVPHCHPDGEGICPCPYGHRRAVGVKGRCEPEGYVLYSTGTTFGRVTLAGSEHTVLYNDTSANIQSFDVRQDTEEIYWSDLNAQAIYRAPADLPARREAVVSGVTAYGLAVDALHSLLYWTDDSRIVMAHLDGTGRLILLHGLDSPAEVAVDPANRLLFWAECGQSLSLRRAHQSGGGVATLAAAVPCGAALLADPPARRLHWRDWDGRLRSCPYDGGLVVTRQAATDAAHSVMSFYDRMFADYYVQPSLVKLVNKSDVNSGAVANDCDDAGCSGLCLPSEDPYSPFCACPDDKGRAFPCSTNSTYSAVTTPTPAPAKGYLRVVGVTPFSVTLRCSGPLLRHPVALPYVQLEEADSLVPRAKGLRVGRTVRVADKRLPFTIDSLNPASTYVVSVRNRVTRASASMAVHTPPPPLALRRLPLVRPPPDRPHHTTLAWHQQGVHFSSPNAWEELVHKEYILLLISKKNYTLSEPFPIKQPVMDIIKKELKPNNFMVIHHYKSKDEFDDDPEVDLGNLPWGDAFTLAMAQVTEYKGAYNLDFVYSTSFSLPDP